MGRRTAIRAAIVIFGVAAGWFLFFGLPKWYGARHTQSTAPAAATAATSTGGGSAVRRITATLFYISEDGMSLAPVQREVPFGANVADQARAILEAQIAASPPLVSAIPADTKLRQVFVTDRGDAFVDLSGDVTAKHTGGALDEILTVYAIVDALTVNLPAITRVQILVDGKEVDTLAGHVDLRHPLAKSMDWVLHDTH
ncbi:MAG TPA: GerMN domain-containing protein [Vicinamibacterales bacterium]|jgi:spore germination protein GerM|nr:GerMN domain-containing protein [Vicinamibacterales bacterium]